MRSSIISFQSTVLCDALRRGGRAVSGREQGCDQQVRALFKIQIEIHFWKLFESAS